MRKSFISLTAAMAAIVTLVTACGDGPDKREFHLKGNIKGIDSGKVVLLKQNANLRGNTPIDSTELVGGQFSFTGSLTAGTVLSINVVPGNWSFQVFVENAEITVDADTTGAKYYDWTSYGGSKGAQIQNYTVTGSGAHDQWMAFEKNPSSQEVMTAITQLQQEYYAKADNKEAQAIIRTRMDSLFQLYSDIQLRWVDSLVSNQPASPATAYLLNNYYTFHRDMPLGKVDSMVSRLTGDAKSTLYHAYLSDELEKRKALQPGKLAPDFTLLQPDSTAFTLSSLRGKVVLVDFWASWCVPCRKAIPHWKEVYKEYHDKGLEIVGVTNDKRWSDWNKALDEEKMPWIQVADEFPVEQEPARVISQYMAPYLPTYVLLDREGKVVLHNGSKEEIDQKLKELL